MLWTITCRRLKRDRRGISNIIVIALSLVIILAIVSNIVLWNYEMNQVDWEKMKEDVSITNVERGIYSSWFLAQSEYSVNTGSRTNGAYTDTQAIDGSYESFIEAVGASDITLIDAESFEGVWPPYGWNETGDWNKESDQEYHGSYSADFDGGSSGVLTTPDLDCSNAESIYVDFWYRDDGSEANEFVLQYYDGNSWDTIYDLGATWSENQWLHYQEEVTDSQYFKSNFKIRWITNTNYYNDDVYVDLVTAQKSASNSSYVLDLTGEFAVNLSTYPSEYIRTVEIELRYRADDSAENWYLKAYNWTASIYSNVGFNSTTGHTPTTGWDYYTVNLTDTWQSYVNIYGEINVKFADQDADSEQTSIDIDFLGVRVKMDGTQFTFENDGGPTVHLVSLWIINSTDHQRYDISVFVNSGETKTYLRYDISLPTGSYTVKVVTERGNTAVYSGS
ncbi:MAG: hypothetical protein O2V44_03525 [Candidatus Bathyarchaeota archaeon]|nr:hypothetical protein [Candidatus Bathyarchaeota archaeon]